MPSFESLTSEYQLRTAPGHASRAPHWLNANLVLCSTQPSRIQHELRQWNPRKLPIFPLTQTHCAKNIAKNEINGVALITGCEILKTFDNAMRRRESKEYMIKKWVDQTHKDRPKRTNARPRRTRRDIENVVNMYAKCPNPVRQFVNIRFNNQPLEHTHTHTGTQLRHVRECISSSTRIEH